MITIPKTSNISNLTLTPIDPYFGPGNDLLGKKWDVRPGSNLCLNINLNGAENGSGLCLPPYSYYPWYIFTKDGSNLKLVNDKVTRNLDIKQHHTFRGVLFIPLSLN